MTAAVVGGAAAGCSDMAPPNGPSATVHTDDSSALAVYNGLAAVNGLAVVNGLAAVNGLAGGNGLAAVNGLASVNGLSQTSGLMTSDDGRRTVSYIAKCALPSGDSLTKNDQSGKGYNFPGGLGLAPGWKNGNCDQSCQELVSACVTAHVNTFGVHYPIWVDSAAPSIGWGLPPSNYQMEGTFFGNIILTGGIGHGSAQGPLGYYCEANGALQGAVAGRVGDSNSHVPAPYYNAYLGQSCDSAARCVAHKSGATTDGYTSCTDQYGNTFNNLVTIWRDPNATLTFDAGYVYSLRAVAGSTGTAVSVTGGNYSNGTPVENARYVATNKIGITDSGAGNGSYKLFFIDNPGKCVDNPGSQTANGTTLQVYDCSANNVWQQWMISVDGATGAAIFKNVGSGRCMDDSGTPSPGDSVRIWDCDANNVNQKWRVAGGFWRPTGITPSIHSVDAYVLLAGNGDGNVAVDNGNNYTNGAKLHLASAIDPNIDERVHILPGTSPNTWIIKFVGGNGNKCLDIPGGQTANGTPAQIWDCNGGANQNWYVSNYPSNGSLQFRNQGSNRCLDDLALLGTSPGMNHSKVAIWDCSANGGFAQGWALTTL